MIDALRTDDVHDVATPADWLLGGAVIIPKSVKTDKGTGAFRLAEPKRARIFA